MITQSNIISVMSNVVKDNSSTDLQCVYLGAKDALGGHRRVYDEVGDLLVWVEANHNFEMDLAQSDVVFQYGTKEFVHANGLPGAMKEDDTREEVTIDVARSCFKRVGDELGVNAYTVLLNPKEICGFLESQTSRTGFDNQKVSLHVLNGASSYLQTVPSTIRIQPSGETMAEIIFPHDQAAYSAGTSNIIVNEHNQIVGLFPIDEKASIEKFRWKERSLIKLVADHTTQTKQAVVVSAYQPGIRLSIQSFQNGLKMLNSPGYQIFPHADARVTENDIAHFPFIRGQEKLTTSFIDSPTIHFDADTLYRALKCMEMFKVVSMTYKDSVTGVYFEARDAAWDFTIKIIAGPTNPYVNGRVWTR